LVYLSIEINTCSAVWSEEFVAKKKQITAGELMRKLEADPEWVAKRDTRAARRAERAKQLADDQAPIVAELAAVGITVTSIYEFVGKQLAPDVALPILVRHLSLAHHETTREVLIRSLGIPSAREIAFDPLRDEYLKERDPILRWVIANAFSTMVRFDEVADLPGIEKFASLFPNRRRKTGRT
jgi:hypothetical protein